MPTPHALQRERLVRARSMRSSPSSATTLSVLEHGERLVHGRAGAREAAGARAFELLLAVAARALRAEHADAGRRVDLRVLGGAVERVAQDLARIRQRVDHLDHAARV